LGLNRKIPLHNFGIPTRNWLHAKDTASGVIKIIEAGEINQIYNIAGGFEQSNIDTVKKIIDVFYGQVFDCYELFVDFSVVRPGQDLRYALNDEKLRKLGWEPKAVFDKEIFSIVEYYKQNFIW
jgi:dTDP-D-glucose 4,6-dehydratase